MSDPRPSPQLRSEHPLSTTVDHACDRFEAAWQRGERPRIEDYLRNVAEPLYSSLLRELLLLEREYRRQQGEPLDREDYLLRFPDHRPLIDDLWTGPSASGDTTCELGTRATGENEPGVTAAARYADLQFHASGGLGEVFRAHDASLNRDVALKFIQHAHVANAELCERFVVEAEVTSRLDHPGVVPVYTMGESWDGRPFYAMRFIEGTSLEQAIDQFHATDWSSRGAAARRHELGRLLRHLAAACNTVAYANNRCIVHCDIKPANVMLGRFGETLMVDWGLAVVVQRDAVGMKREEQTLLLRSASAADSTSASGAGTVPFMSPEQCPGSNEPITPRSDVYSLGATLYVLLSGRNRFHGCTREQAYDRICHGDFPSPREMYRSVRADESSRGSRATEIPRALEAICLKALRTRPEDRYASARDMADDLERWLSDEPVSVYREPPFERLIRVLRRRQSWARSLAAALLLVLLTATISAVWLAGMYRRESDARSAAADAQRDALWMAAHYTAEALGKEVDLRWQILEREAAHETPVQVLQMPADERTIGSQAQRQLQAWIAKRFFENRAAAPSASWFLNDASGIQVARYPPSGNIGQSFAHRQYFHGEPESLVSAESPQPIQEPHLSAAYASRSTGNLRVAFSVPVWNASPETGARQVLGVLAMSVEMADFHALTGHGEKWSVNLIDRKADETDSALRGGLVLHHPELVRMRFEQSIEDASELTWRLGEEQLAAFEDVARRTLAHEQRLRHLALRGYRGEQRQPVRGSLQDGYRDPILGGTRWTAALAPVLVTGRSEQQFGNGDALRDIGWMVVVQQKNVAGS